MSHNASASKHAARRLRLPRWAMAAAIVLVCVAMASPLLCHMDRMARHDCGDWLEAYFHQSATREAILREGEPPFWCAYINGGYPLAAHPINPAFSPLLPVTLLAGELAAPRINVALALVAGVIGMALLARCSLRLSPWGAAFATLVYASSGWMPVRLYGGNYVESFFYIFPLILFSLHRAARDRRFLFLGTVLLYLLLSQCSIVYPVVVFFLGLVWVAGRYFFPGAKSKLPRALSLRIVACAVLCSCLIGAAKLNLVLRLFSTSPRRIDYASVRAPNPSRGGAAVSFLLSRFAAFNRFPSPVIQRLRASSVGLSDDYVGCGLLTIVLGMVAGLWAPRRFLAAAILIVVSTLIAMGRYLTIDLFYPLSFLPLFHSIFDPSKYFNYFMLFFTCIAGGGFFHLAFSRSRSALAKSAAVLLMLAAVGVPLAENSRLMSCIFAAEIPRVQRNKEFFQVDHYPLYWNLKRGLGVIDWPEAYARPVELMLDTNVRPKLVHVSGRGEWAPSPDYRGEVYLIHGNGTAKLRRIGFNHIKVCAELTAPDTVVINQNYALGWHTDRGEIRNHQSLLAVRLKESGAMHLALTYRPPGIYLSALVSLASALGLGVFCFTRVGKRRVGSSP